MTRLFLALGLLGLAPAADAQTSVTSGVRSVDSSAGVIGERQSRTVLQEAARVAPMARLESRVSNRIRARLQTRIDRDPTNTTNTLSVFSEADERIRRNPATRPPR